MEQVKDFEPKDVSELLVKATRNPVEQEEELRFQTRERKASQLLFADLCHRLERVTHEVGKRHRRLEILFPRPLVHALKGCSPYPLFRLLLPQIDTTRKNYSIKQAGLAKLYVEILGLDPRHSRDAQKLLRYRQPPPPRALDSTPKRPCTFDWPDVLEDVLATRVTQHTSRATLGEINEVLDQLTR